MAFEWLVPWGILTLLGWIYILVDSDIWKPIREWIARKSEFLGKLTQCRFCTAFWLALPVFGLMYLAHDWPLVIALLTLPAVAVGIVFVITHLSPRYAAERIVDVAADVAQAILTANQQPPEDTHG